LAVWDDEAAWKASHSKTESEELLGHKRAVYVKNMGGPSPVDQYTTFGPSGEILYERDFRTYPLGATEHDGRRPTAWRRDCAPRPPALTSRWSTAARSTSVTPARRREVAIILASSSPRHSAVSPRSSATAPSTPRSATS